MKLYAASKPAEHEHWVGFAVPSQRGKPKTQAITELWLHYAAKNTIDASDTLR